jgi:hypothetical protein
MTDKNKEQSIRNTNQTMGVHAPLNISEVGSGAIDW